MRFRCLRLMVYACMLCELSGCSVLFTSQVPDDYTERPNFTCTTNRTLAAIDLTLAGASAAMGALILAIAHSFNGELGDEAYAISATFFTPAIVNGVSAGYGFTRAADCEAAIEHLDALDHERQRLATSEPASCAYDTQCNDARICVQHRCVDPPATSAATNP